MRRCTALLVVCTGLIAWIAGVLPASAAPRRVVLLYDERPELPGLALVQADFVRTLTANAADPIEVYNEAMDLSRFGSSGYPGLLREFLRAKYADKKIDVAIAIMGPALERDRADGRAVPVAVPSDQQAGSAERRQSDIVAARWNARLNKALRTQARGRPQGAAPLFDRLVSSAAASPISRRRGPGQEPPS